MSSNTLCGTPLAGNTLRHNFPCIGQGPYSTGAHPPTVFSRPVSFCVCRGGIDVHVSLLSMGWTLCPVISELCKILWKTNILDSLWIKLDFRAWLLIGRLEVLILRIQRRQRTMCSGRYYCMMMHECMLCSFILHGIWLTLHWWANSYRIWNGFSKITK